MRTVVCGKGRLGQLIASTLSVQGADCEYARIDAMQGLLQGSLPVTGEVHTLILCFVPKHDENKSGWQGLLQGLLSQAQNGHLKIQRVLFISSTAVYEAVERGFVDAHTSVSGASVRSRGLIDAEKIIPQLSVCSTIFRLTGLVGPGYNKYDPVTYSGDKPRQAVDTRAVATAVASWFTQQQRGHRIEVLTDGFIYWQGKALDPVEDCELIEILVQKNRLLKPSLICRPP